MNDNKKNRLKGSVLYTVIAVMMIMTVFVFAALTLAASANKRVHNVYANNQTQYTARSVVDGMMAILEQNGKDAVGTVDVDKLNASLDSSWGKVTAASIQDVGSIKDLENKGINFGLNLTTSQKTERRVYKLSATVNMQGQENTVALYCYDGEEDKPHIFKNSLTSMGALMMSNAGGLFTGDVYSYINNGATSNGDVYINQKFELNGSYGTDSSVSIFAGADITINDYNKGVYIGGNFIPTGSNINLSFYEPIEPIKPTMYTQLPYMFIGKSFGYAGGITKKIGANNQPFITMVDTLIDGWAVPNPNQSSDAGFENINYYGDVYLFAQNGEESNISAAKDSGIHPWNTGIVSNKTSRGEFYTGGNLYSRGKINIVGTGSVPANNIVANELVFWETNSAPSGAVVAGTVDLSVNTGGDKTWTFNKGLFTDPANFRISEGRVVNGITCDFSSIKQVGWENTATYYTDQSNPDISVWSNNDITHTLNFKVDDLWNGIFWDQSGNQYTDPSKIVFIEPRSLTINFDRNTSDMTPEAIERGDFIKKLTFDNGAEIELFENGSSIGTNSINLENASQSPNSFTVNLPTCNVRDSGILKLKLTDIESGYWKTIPMVTDPEPKYTIKYQWNKNNHWVYEDVPETETKPDYNSYHWEWNTSESKWEKVDGPCPDGLIDPRITHPENCYWSEEVKFTYIEVDIDGKKQRVFDKMEYSGGWVKNNDYEYQTEWREDKSLTGGGYYVYYVQTNSINSINVSNISLKGQPYEDNSTIYGNMLENYLKKINDVSFDNTSDNTIYIDDIDKSVTLKKTIDSITGRTVMNISVKKIDGTVEDKGSYDYDTQYAQFMRAVVDTVTFPESMEKDKVLDVNGGFVNTSFMSEDYRTHLTSNSWTYNDVKDKLTGVNTYSAPNNGTWYKIDKDGNIEKKYDDENGYDVVYSESHDESNPITENCILTGSFTDGTLVIDPGNKDIYIGLYQLKINNSNIVVEDDEGKGKVYFFVPGKGIPFKYENGGTVYDETTGPVWGYGDDRDITDIANPTGGTERNPYWISDCGYLSLSNSKILTRTYFEQLTPEGTENNLKIFSKLIPDDGKNYVPNIYLYMDYNEPNMGLYLGESLISGYIMAPTALANLDSAKKYNVSYDGTNYTDNISVIGSAIFKVTHFLNNSAFMYIDESGNSDSNANKKEKFTKLYYQAY